MAVGIGIKLTSLCGIGDRDRAVPHAVALLPREARRIDEHGAQVARFEIEIELHFLIFAGRIVERVDGAVHHLVFVVSRSMTLGLAQEYAGVAFLPVTNLLL